MLLSHSSVIGVACGISTFFFFFNDPAPPEIYPLSLHDALPISPRRHRDDGQPRHPSRGGGGPRRLPELRRRSEEHTSELQSRLHLVCRLLLEKKKNKTHSVCSTRP